MQVGRAMAKGPNRSAKFRNKPSIQTSGWVPFSRRDAGPSVARVSPRLALYLSASSRCMIFVLMMKPTVALSYDAAALVVISMIVRKRPTACSVLAKP